MWTPDAVLMRLEPLRRHLAVWRAAWQMEQRRPHRPPRTAAELAFLPAAIEIMETPPSPAGRLTGAIIMAMFGSAVIWACLGQVDIHATAQGRIIPAGNTKPVAASESTTVTAIHVRDGDHVEAGQVLVELDPTDSQADQARYARERLENLIIAAGYHALLDGKTDLVLPPDVAVPADLLALHRSELLQKLADHRSTRDALEQERRQKEAEQRGTQADIRRLEKTVPLLAEQSDTKREMSALGWQSRTEYLKIEQEHIDRQQELESARHKLAEDESAIANVTERLKETEAKFRADAFTQMADAEQKAASLAQEEIKARQRMRQHTLTAPVSGVVQQLAVHANGAVVSQAQPVLMIVPEGEGIAVEAALQNKDAGFVRSGQPVEIKVESFPFTRYGTIPGEVTVVSSDTVQGSDSDPTRKPATATDPASTGRTKEELGAVYSVRVHPSRDWIRADEGPVKLAPGMAVTAEIRTGRRRVIEYVLDPVLRYWGESLRER
ncbi:HlyD family type I secretion periplasmic adaptor subunit [Telmatospirillum sp.]|uniref:HlyD family type I secretion periplasmic adaptor subunit n=1 Tax=Telmatospirillum sp. TaxID=2079197 RepID=UPI00284224B6|nr:HlyD family type I secretion periplasmic adaptor subunit [Telmatospirillum sp.]MDR3440667.1 HlyD family type I secretion periplasmic adaptor subunit [Telmatospirillum sp.]